MKKQAVRFMAVVMTVGLLAGCGSTTGDNGNSNGTTGSETQDSGQNSTQNNGQDSSGTGAGNGNGTSQNGTGGDYRIGLGVVSVLERTANAGETDGSAEVSTVMAAVTVDGEDRIVNCSLDAIEHVISVSNTGAFATQARTEFQTKKELGADYGMRPASGIGKEWYEQAEAFETYAVGKTVQDINGIKTDNNGYIQDDTLNTSVTISISDFQAAISKAVENAV